LRRRLSALDSDRYGLESPGLPAVTPRAFPALTTGTYFLKGSRPDDFFGYRFLPCRGFWAAVEIAPKPIAEIITAALIV